MKYLLLLLLLIGCQQGDSGGGGSAPAVQCQDENVSIFNMWEISSPDYDEVFYLDFRGAAYDEIITVYNESDSSCAFKVLVTSEPLQVDNDLYNIITLTCVSEEATDAGFVEKSCEGYKLIWADGVIENFKLIQ